MPPIIKITKENILKTALNIVNEEGINSLNARRLAKELNCSVQPLYYQFSNMDELKTELIKSAYKCYEEYIYETKNMEISYLSSGMAYIRFAKEKSNLFHLLFMTPYDNKIKDPTLDYVYDLVMKKTGLTLQQAKEFQFNMWIFVHGIATMIFTKIIDFKIEEIENLLKIQYDALIRRYKNG